MKTGDVLPLANINGLDPKRYTIVLGFDSSVRIFLSLVVSQRCALVNWSTYRDCRVSGSANDNSQLGTKLDRVRGNIKRHYGTGVVRCVAIPLSSAG